MRLAWELVSRLQIPRKDPEWSNLATAPSLDQSTLARWADVYALMTRLAGTVLDGGGAVFREGKEGLSYSPAEVRARRCRTTLQEETEVNAPQSRLRRTLPFLDYTLYLALFPYAGNSFYQFPPRAILELKCHLLFGGAFD